MLRLVGRISWYYRKTQRVLSLGGDTGGPWSDQGLDYR